ncbi:HAD family phosphatase [Amycolatopsis sp. EV170708-02-1]|uniref:HAD family hydrolase n=1 Tax=Amycolatopsis sp. EV170708-02-1 TaxID=2919322 RepID=UPI001F0BF2CD|nr:HAD family phosphatase [Amycolatopsis sp. EV170708-02-1]UMP02829.1 HAD family phosphatase [Amycolatopsis sp. EV170708-02-1]
MKGFFGGRNPRAVVFDCDGLLFARRGLPFGADEKALVIGKSLPAAADAMAAAAGEPDAGAEIADELLRLVTEVVTAKAEAMPGARELVELTAAAVPVAVASNSPRALLDAALVRGGLAEMFPVKLAADEVTAPKPDPEMYLTACGLLNVEPADALAFEDSMTGLGVPVIGVPTLKHQDFPADVVIGSLRDEELLSWVRGWSRR